MRYKSQRVTSCNNPLLKSNQFKTIKLAAHMAHSLHTIPGFFAKFNKKLALEAVMMKYICSKPQHRKLSTCNNIKIG